MIGKTLGHYEILEKLGVGGMGEVYLARDAKLGREIALKILPPAAAHDPERRERFAREAKTVASLQHPHIVTIYSIEETDGTHFLTMELVKGKTLAELIPADGLALERLFEIGVPLADAVHAAHEQGVIHRDLKPGNIMIDDAGRLKVLDFGLAKLLPIVGDVGAQTMTAGGGDASDATAEGRVLGTVAYMSPEQAEGKDLDRRSDIFSLGVVLYEATTGKRPFSGDTPISTISSILRETPPTVTSLKPLPRHLGRVIHRCLEKNPDKRFQTARDVGNELEGLKQEVESGEHEPASWMLASGMTQAPPAASRGRKAAWFGLTAAAVLAAAVIIVLMRSNRTPPATEALPALSITPLSSSVGVEYVGSWSPDGSFFAYSHSANGPQDIFIRSTAGGDPVRLVESPWDDQMPMWSPDNRWIAFFSNRDGRSGLYLIPPLGGAIRHLSDLGFEPLEGSFGVGASPWSPDGRQLVYARLQDGAAALWMMDLTTGDETRLTALRDADDSQAAWSFDGRYIAFQRIAAGESSVWVMNADGSEERKLYTAAEEEIGSVNWSPDSQSVVFLTTRPGDTNRLWSVDIESETIRQLTSMAPHFETNICVGRDGRIMVNDFSHQTDLYLQRIDSRDARRLTHHTESNFGARISPEGDRLVYASDRTGNPEIWVLDLESGKELQLTDHEAEDAGPDWSPDGKTIVFASRRSGRSALWAVDASGAAARLLLDHGDAWAPRWSPDGSAIGFLARSGGVTSLWLCEPDGSRPRKAKDDVRDFVWYRDNRRLIYTPASELNSQIRTVDLESGQDALVLDEPHIELAVNAKGDALTYSSARSHFNMNLHLLRLETGEDGLPRAAGTPIALTAGAGEWHVHNGGFTPDGESVVYTRDTDTGNVFMVEGVF